MPPQEWDYEKYQVRYARSFEKWGFWCPHCWEWFWCIPSENTYQVAHDYGLIHHHLNHDGTDSWDTFESLTSPSSESAIYGF